MTYSIFNHAQLGQVCEAVQHSDQKVCTPCDQAWDINDPAPPACKREAPQQKRVRSPRGWAVAAGLGLGKQFASKR